MTITLYQTENEPREGLIHTYAKDENNISYNILQTDTGIIYADAVDVMPLMHTYEIAI